VNQDSLKNAVFEIAGVSYVTQYLVTNQINVWSSASDLWFEWV